MFGIQETLMVHLSTIIPVTLQIKITIKPIKYTDLIARFLISKFAYFHKVKNTLRLLLSFLLLILAYSPQTRAQANNRSPELAQMYNHALDFINAKNYSSAIIILKQEIVLEPENILVAENLGKALLLNGETGEAINILKATIKKPAADSDAYHYLVLAYIKEGKTRSAMKTIDLAQQKFRASGLLQNDKGKIHLINGNEEDALYAFLDGFSHKYAYAENFKDASLIYLKHNEYILGVIYLEIYLNLVHDTAFDDTLKKQLYIGWKNLCEQNEPYIKKEPDKRLSIFQTADHRDAIAKELFELRPITSDGVSTENLIMLRTRLIMNYLKKNQGTQFEYQLFVWLNNLIKNGKFDIYNEWLFGKAVSESEYNAWNTFHEGDLNRFTTWKADHPYKQDGLERFSDLDYYNIFKKRKGKLN